MNSTIMLASHEIFPSRPPREKAVAVDLSAGYSLRERWKMSGETLPARVVNSLGRVANYLGNMDSEAQPCHEYFAAKPNTLRERASRVRAGLTPALIMIKFGHVIGELKVGAKDSLNELRGQENPSEDEPLAEF